VNCHETQELLHAYLDGELDVVSDVALAHHMDQCPECAQAYHSQQALRAALRTSALAFPPPEHLQQRIRSAVRRASRTDTRAHVQGVGRRASQTWGIRLPGAPLKLHVWIPPLEYRTEFLIEGLHPRLQ
jgi:mycothiol system anti-sigma-R factor